MGWFYKNSLNFDKITTQKITVTIILIDEALMAVPKSGHFHFNFVTYAKLATDNRIEKTIPTPILPSSPILPNNVKTIAVPSEENKLIKKALP